MYYFKVIFITIIFWKYVYIHLFILLFPECVYVCVQVCYDDHMMVKRQLSGVVQAGFSCHPVGCGDSTQLIRPGHKSPYPLSHPVYCWHYFTEYLEESQEDTKQ